MENQDQFEQWAIVELFGHTRLAGKVSEAEIGAGSLIRVDIPQDTGEGWAFTKYIGVKAVYAINVVDEGIAREAAKRFQVKPVYGYELPALASDPQCEDDMQDFDDMGAG